MQSPKVVRTLQVLLIAFMVQLITAQLVPFKPSSHRQERDEVATLNPREEMIPSQEREARAFDRHPSFRGRTPNRRLPARTTLAAPLPIESDLNEQSDREGKDIATLNSDLHKGHHGCVNTSEPGPVTWDDVTQDVCTCKTEKKCNNVDRTVSVDVTEMLCDVTPYTDCKMTMRQDRDCMESHMEPMDFTPKKCETTDEIVQHQKFRPKCQNTTKQQCNIHFDLDGNGNKIFPPSKVCKDVVWEECHLEPYFVDFKVPKVECDDGEPIPFHMYQDKPKPMTTSHMECEVKHSIDCQPVTTKKTKPIRYQECWDEVSEECKPVKVKKPEQILWPKEFCLQ